MNPVILIVDDDADSRNTLAQVLRKENYTAHTAASGSEAIEWFDRNEVDLVITDIRMDEMDGIDLLRLLKARREDLPVIIMTAFASVDTAVQAVDERAFDYVRKPYQLAQIRSTVRRALEHSRLIHDSVVSTGQEPTPASASRIVGTSPAMVDIYKTIARVAKTDTTVLITGESGTGKELVAHAIHSNSLRTQQPFLALNCGALTETLLESELFGHVRGAFTGAVTSRKGIFETAQYGTVFLDEISETSTSLQKKLLRVLEERQITRVGTAEAAEIDVRVIAATNRSLQDLVEARKFREDLFYRLHVVEINLPPLREHVSDLPLLFDYFLARYTVRLGKTLAVAAGLVDFLCKYPWPGNVRELENVVERAVALNHTGILDVDDLPREILSWQESGKPLNSLLSLEEMERQYIAQVIDAAGGNMSRAAEVLKVDRRTLYRMVDRHGLWSERLQKPPREE